MIIITLYKTLIAVLKKNYKYTNITFILLAIYVVIFPLISVGLEKINPTLTKCVYLQKTGKECPLCGGTRYIKNIGEVFADPTYLFNFFGVIIIVVLLNIILRFILLIYFNKIKNIDIIIKLDLYTHLILLFLYLMYEIVFVIYNL
ncbi:MAG TPA: hypothetical protein PK993_00625 [Clostridia bacterium]|nr:hypothetical protein [Clostridia bacterium]